MNKYELTDNTRMFCGHTLHQIRYLRDIGDSIKAGDLGGWIEKEENLSQYGDAQVCGDAFVCGSAEVFDNASVYGNALVYGDAKVCGQAFLRDLTLDEWESIGKAMGAELAISWRFGDRTVQA